jgi:hypothetical protein
VLISYDPTRGIGSQGDSPPKGLRGESRGPLRVPPLGGRGPYDPCGPHILFLTAPIQTVTARNRLPKAGAGGLPHACFLIIVQVIGVDLDWIITLRWSSAGVAATATGRGDRAAREAHYEQTKRTLPIKVFRRFCGLVRPYFDLSCSWCAGSCWTGMRCKARCRTMSPPSAAASSAPVPRDR